MVRLYFIHGAVRIHPPILGVTREGNEKEPGLVTMIPPADGEELGMVFLAEQNDREFSPIIQMCVNSCPTWDTTNGPTCLCYFDHKSNFQNLRYSPTSIILSLFLFFFTICISLAIHVTRAKAPKDRGSCTTYQWISQYLVGTVDAPLWCW